VSSVQEALSKPLKDYAGVIADVMLPNDPMQSGISAEETHAGYMAGVALVRQIRKLGHTIPLILFSAGEALEAEKWAADQRIPFVKKEDGQRALLSVLSKLGLITSLPGPRAFIVHGHDEASLAELKDYLQNTLKWPMPIVLREQPNIGKTTIEKFEEHASRIDCVFVLLTPDDKDINFSTDDDKRRARQNVIFELGFFYGQMDRQSGRIIALRKGPMELPSDMQGIVWIDITKGIKEAGEDIRKEVAHLTNP
jgi:CheY-like chemotaxis protein